MTKLMLTVALLGATIAAPAAAVVDITKVPSSAFAVFSQQPVARGTTPKLAYYKNEDTEKTTGTTVRTPHTVVTPAVYRTDPIYGTSGANKGKIVGYKQTLVTPAKSVTTYTSVTTYATVITPKAEIYTTIGSGSLLASPIVNFRYLASVPVQVQAQLAGLQSAKLTLSTVSTSAAVVAGTDITQLFDSGSLTFQRANPVVVRDSRGRIVGHPLSNLLTVHFTNAVLAGTVGSSAFTFDASTPISTITYTSDFLNFANTFNNDLSLTFNAAVPQLSVAVSKPTAFNQTNVTGAHTLNSTRATVAGQFGASAVPEPAAWSLMIAGFAMVGLRRRSRTAALAS